MQMRVLTVKLYLVDSGDDLGGCEKFLDVGDGKVRDTDSLNFAGVEKLLHGSPGLVKLALLLLVDSIRAIRLFGHNCIILCGRQ